MISAQQREPLHATLQRLLDEHAPPDALAAYYLFHHSGDRVDVFTHAAPALGRADGFLVRARTGLDLFRPVVTFRADTEEAAQALFREGLPPNRPVYLIVPESLGPWAGKYLALTDLEPYRLYRFDANRQAPEINILVVSSTGPDGTPRCEIRAAGNRPGAVAGVNWQSPRFAEIYVNAEPAVRGRGWGKSVVAALARLLNQTGRTALYLAGETNDASRRLAEAAGFVDTGHRVVMCQATPPGPAPSISLSV